MGCHFDDISWNTTTGQSETNGVPHYRKICVACRALDVKTKASMVWLFRDKLNDVVQAMVGPLYPPVLLAVKMHIVLWNQMKTCLPEVVSPGSFFL